jgi:hypothetical protein
VHVSFCQTLTNIGICRQIAVKLPNMKFHENPFKSFDLLYATNRHGKCEISSSHGGDYEIQNCLLRCPAL